MEQTITRKKKLWPWMLLSVTVLAVAGVLCYIFWPRPLVTGQAYVAADLESVTIYNEEGAVHGELIRGSTVMYVVEEADEERPGMIRLVMSAPADAEEIFEKAATFAWIEETALTDDPAKVVKTEAMYAYNTVNLLDLGGTVPGELVEKGEKLTVIGFDGLDETGAVARYKVSVLDASGAAAEGYIRASYLRRTQEEAAAIYDEEQLQLHTKRGDSWGGGDAAGLDYAPREKVKFENNVMPEEVKALYLNNTFLHNLDAYLEIADGCGINAFVIDIQDGSAIGYASPVMQQFSPSTYAGAYNTLEDYQAGVKKIKDAGYYVIGRITAFNDANLAKDHPELVIANKSGSPLKIGGMYWPSVYQRDVWKYKVDLAMEAAELMGFNEIQFDYCRFPDGTWNYDKSGNIDYRNTYQESKAQAVQRFLMYACDRLHDAGVYVSADVFGECAEAYVCAYGQYWPAITNVVDAISAMPYPDHYSAYGDWLPWEHPYETLQTFGKKAAARQTEVPTPGAVRTWIQAYNAIREPYTAYGPSQIRAQIKALRDTGNTGGYMTWNAAASVTKYRYISSALD